MNENLVAKLEEKRDRRGLLALIGGGGIAAVAALVAGGSKDADAAHDGTNVLHVGQENISPASAITRLTGDSEDFLVTVENQSGAKAIQAIGGFIGFSEDSQAGEFATNTGIGAWGQAESGVGLWGASWSGVGVVGAGGSRQADPLPDPVGPGVLGFTPGEDAPGVRAVSGSPALDDIKFPVPDGGLALDVVGKARFSTAGASTVNQGQNARNVQNPAVTTDSHISVTLMSDPGPRQIQWVERRPGIGFRLHMTSAPQNQRPATQFTYLIVEPG